eukprot:scaffold201487_cov28-Tisochrysis_lutea.AAC.3
MSVKGHSNAALMMAWVWSGVGRGVEAAAALNAAGSHRQKSAAGIARAHTLGCTGRRASARAGGPHDQPRVG